MAAVVVVHARQVSQEVARGETVGGPSRQNAKISAGSWHGVCGNIITVPRKVDVKGNSNSHGAKPVHQIISVDSDQ
jgi:hypothetical protein